MILMDKWYSGLSRQMIWTLRRLQLLKHEPTSLTPGHIVWDISPNDSIEMKYTEHVDPFKISLLHEGCFTVGDMHMCGFTHYMYSGTHSLEEMSCAISDFLIGKYPKYTVLDFI
jgi:hypothetical protein